MVPSAAAVCSEETVAPMNTPCCHDSDSVTSGHVGRAPAAEEDGIDRHPAGSSQLDAIDGHCSAGAVNRALGWAAGVSDAGVQSLPFQSMTCAGGSSVIPSHHTSLSSVRATLV